MNMKKIVTLMLSVVLAVGIFAACGNDNDTNTESGTNGEQNNKVIIATGPKSGQYYEEGKKIAKELNDNGIEAEIIETEGTEANLRMIKRNEAQLAIVMRDAVDDDENVKAIRELHRDYIQVIATKESNITALDQIKGKKVAVGLKESGVEENAEEVLDQYGIDYMDLEVEYIDSAAAVEALKTGKVDVAFVTSGLPNKSVEKLYKEKEIVVLSVGNDRIVQDLMDDGYEKAVIPAKTYGNKEDVDTLSIKNILVASENLSNDTVNKIKDILKNY